MTRRHPRGASARPPAQLLRLHRHSLSNLVVQGGTEAERLAIARAFHRASPLRRGAFLAIDCARDQPRLHRALQSWLAPEGAPPGPQEDRECGTLFLDSVACLSPETQRLLLVLACRMQSGPQESRTGPGPFRLSVGSAESLGEAVEERRFSGALYDLLDKIRIDLGQMPRRGAA